MRILQVRFKNLNSLVGQWEIDLTHPNYVTDGIFAITGPTGAGKTTILDAICLALYGRTPRLNKVTKSGNEIMSRQTGECFAEVTFETQAGRYRCHWSQHRARRKPDGELQPPKHEIADADSGQIFEAKLRGVADQIATVTGMDFERFTRSMLLAQGGFAAFLQAPPDDRAPILEQITGTEIYSQISIRVHLRCSHERRLLGDLLAELAGMQLLTPEEEQELCEHLQQKAQQAGELDRQITQKEKAIAWIGDIAKLEQQIKQLGDARDEWEAKIEAFAPEKAKLDAAVQALELAADYAELTGTRKTQELDQHSLDDKRKALPGCEEAVKLAEQTTKKAEEKLSNAKSAQQELLPIIRKVQTLDVQITEKDAPIASAKKSVEQASRSLQSLREKQDADCTHQERQRNTLQELLGQLEATQADEALVEQLAAIRERFDALRNLHGQLAGKLGEIRQGERGLQEILRAWETATRNREERQHTLAGIQQEISKKRAELENVLQHRPLPDWRESITLLSKQEHRLANALQAARSRMESQKTVEELDNHRRTLAEDQTSLTARLERGSETQGALEEERDRLEDELILLNRIEHLEDARQHLQDGQPCPLCGSREHPFAEGNVPVPDETRQRLVAAKKDLKSVAATVARLTGKLSGIGKDIEYAAFRQKDHAERIEQANRLIREALADLPSEFALEASDPKLAADLQRQDDANRQALQQATETVQAAEQLDKVLDTLRESIETGRDLAAKAVGDAQTAQNKKENAEQLLERLRNEAAEFQIRQENSLSRLQDDLLGFGVESLSVDHLDGVCDELNTRRNQWITRQKKKAELAEIISALDVETRQRAEQIQDIERALKTQKELLDGLQQERDVVIRERQDLFGTKSPDQEETRLAAAIDSANKEWDAARHQSSQADKELNQLSSTIEGLGKAIAARNVLLTSLESAFRNRLEQTGFSNEEAYRSACLPENKRKELGEQAKLLADEKTRWEAKQREAKDSLATKRLEAVTGEPLDDLKQAMTTLIAEEKNLQQEVGGIRQKLKDNEDLKQQHQQRSEAIETQKQECQRWDLLHRLIGSADGKKYRNFAQGLTFEMMIGHANRQLQKMTDRYLLVRDEAQPLELNVIDSYQAGEIRSTKNLSGGESFLVSLALALGLSHMASRNVRVDSLFLDEGFGTLDEDALDTALETLAGLQQDGKLIGVISHVPALKERISTQIQVSPRTGGRSQLSGPGCSRTG